MKLSLDNLQRLSNKVLDLHQKDGPFTVKCKSKYDGGNKAKAFMSFKTQQTLPE